MARASLRVDLTSRGASLQTIARELRAMDDRHVTDLFRRRMLNASKPFVRAVRLSAMAIPVIPEGRHTGLRARIAGCVETASWGRGRETNVAVQVNGHRMPEHEKGLPLYMEGIPGGRINHARWRHPVFGRSDDPWEQQQPHPFFHPAVDGFGRASGEALKAALKDITRKING